MNELYFIFSSIRHKGKIVQKVRLHLNQLFLRSVFLGLSFLRNVDIRLFKFSKWHFFRILRETTVHHHHHQREKTTLPPMAEWEMRLVILTSSKLVVVSLTSPDADFHYPHVVKSQCSKEFKRKHFTEC